MFTKGASEIVLSKCSHIVHKNNSDDPNKMVTPIGFSEDDLNNVIQTVIEPMASNGLRTICIAYRDFPEDMGKIISDSFLLKSILIL